MTLWFRGRIALPQPSILALAAILAGALAGCTTQQQTAPAAAPESAAAPAETETVPANDNLNAVLWTQRSVEFKGNAETAFALARLRLDQALRDRKWTAAPVEQTNRFATLPPAVILDVDETVLDNSAYQAWNVTAGTSFDPQTWTAFVNSKTSVPVPGAVEFTQYAASRNVAVYYVTNRTQEEEPATRENLEAYGFPMGGNVDTLLTAQEQPEWKSAKGTRRAFIAQDHRIVLLIGDNFGDFVDDYRGTEEQRQQIFEANKTHWGHDWIVIANPTYGSFESAPYNHDFKQPDAQKRQAKRAVLQSWPGP
jgi:5'-nucleotidase (lipoprotein e(P4) family)